MQEGQQHVFVVQETPLCAPQVALHDRFHAAAQSVQRLKGRDQVREAGRNSARRDRERLGVDVHALKACGSSDRDTGCGEAALPRHHFRDSTLHSTRECWAALMQCLSTAMCEVFFRTNV